MTKKRKSAYIFRKGDEVRCIGCPEAGSLQGKLRPDVKYHVISCDQNTLTVSVNPLDGLDGAGITAGSFRFIPWVDEPAGEPRFKPGDVVRCVRPAGELREDIKYFVIHCDPVYVRVLVDPGDVQRGNSVIAGVSVAAANRFIPWVDEPVLHGSSPVDIPEDVIEQGDTVRCINNQGAEQYLMEGRDYHVESVSTCGRQRIRLADIHGCGYEWQQARFELVKKAAGVKEVPDVVSGAIPLEGISRETLEKLKTPHPLRIKSTRNDETGETETTVEEIPGAKIDKEFERLLFNRISREMNSQSGRQAFPLDAPPSQTVVPGMTLLEWYAGMALPYYLSRGPGELAAVDDCIKVAKAMIWRLADVQEEKAGQGCVAESPGGATPEKADTAVDPGGCGGNYCCDPQAGTSTITPV
jgi:hypothetical protein